MAIKARLNVRKSDFGVAIWIIIVVMVAFVMFLFEPAMSLVPENLRQTVSIVIYILYFAAFIVLLIYTSLWYHMVLTHKDLYIERHFLFFHGEAATIECKYFTDITPANRYTGSAKPKNYTVMKLDGFGKYVLSYTENGVEKAAKIQCTRRFHDHIVESIALNQRQAANLEKKKSKEKEKKKNKSKSVQ